MTTEFVPSTFTTKTGKVVRTQAHVATFNHIHNAFKSKALMALYDRSVQKHITTGMSLAQLHAESTVSYAYLKSRLGTWCLPNWNYVTRKACMVNGRPGYVYFIGDRGVHFVRDRIPPEWLQRYAAEIREARSA